MFVALADVGVQLVLRMLGLFGTIKGRYGVGLASNDKDKLRFQIRMSIPEIKKTY